MKQKKISDFMPLIIFAIVILVGAFLAYNPKESIPEDTSPKFIAVKDQSTGKLVLVDEDKKKEEKSNDKLNKENDIKNNEKESRENLVGISNKPFSNIEESNPKPVRNDKTGKWKIIKVATDKNILEYTKSYYNSNFNSDNEIHAIVNFTTNTTTKISKVSSNILSVTIHQYIDNEEHNADILFGGKVINEYNIYLDNGDIQKIR